MSRENKAMRRVVGESPWQGTPLPIRTGRRAWRNFWLAVVAVWLASLAVVFAGAWLWVSFT